MSKIDNQFENLVGRLLLANNFLIKPKVPGDLKVDFLASFNRDGWAIEVKFYRTARAQISLIESAAARLSNLILSHSGLKGMLVISSFLSLATKLTLEKKFGLVLIDRTVLNNWAAQLPDIADELNSILEGEQHAADFSMQRDLISFLNEPNHPAVAMQSDFFSSYGGKNRPTRHSPVDTKGTELSEELRLLKRGRTSWDIYEELCKQILQYLFPNDLVGWHSQKRTDDGLNRFDYICRIKPGIEFWTFLIENLNSRYVLFEFKNYVGRIKQGQILTTEKYLLEKGLRRVAIIFSRDGADEGAIKMTQGAMRENGKLMLVLDDKKVREMLLKKERGDDPADLLFEVVDKFLLELPR